VELLAKSQGRKGWVHQQEARIKLYKAALLKNFALNERSTTFRTVKKVQFYFKKL